MWVDWFCDIGFRGKDINILEVCVMLGDGLVKWLMRV